MLGNRLTGKISSWQENHFEILSFNVSFEFILRTNLNGEQIWKSLDHICGKERADIVELLPVASLPVDNVMLPYERNKL